MRRMLLGAVATILFAASVTSAQYVTTTDRAYRDIDALEVRGHHVVPATTMKPYTRLQVALGVHALLADSTRLSPYEKQLAHRLMERFGSALPDSLRPADITPPAFLDVDFNPRALAQSDSFRLDQPRMQRLPATYRLPTEAVRGIGTMELSFHLSEHLSSGHRLEVDTDGLNDNDYNGRLKNYRAGAVGYIPVAYLSYELPWIIVSGGRHGVSWGPGRQGNLHISDNPQPYDMISAEVHRGWFHFSWFTSWLPQTSSTQRYMAAHRLVVTPYDWLEIGYSESVNYSNANVEFSWWRSNPVSSYIVDEIDREGPGANVLNSADVTVRPVPGVEAYAAVVIDDYSLSGETPHHMGWTLGARWEAPFGFDRVGLSTEFTRLSRWLYNYYNNDSAQEHVAIDNASAGRVITLGHFMGPDGEAFFFDGWWESLAGYRVTGLFSLRREGDTSLLTPYPQDASGTQFGYSHEDVPHGIVETATTLGVSVETPEYRGVVASFTLLGRMTDNVGNVDGATDDELFGRLELEWHLPVKLPRAW